MDNNELKKIMDTPIDDLLDLSSRPFICLKHNAKIELIRDLVKFKARDLLRIRGLGKKTLKEIEYELSIKNLYLGMDLSKIEINDQLNLSNKNSENRIKYEHLKSIEVRIFQLNFFRNYLKNFLTNTPVSIKIATSVMNESHIEEFKLPHDLGHCFDLKDVNR